MQPSEAVETGESALRSIVREILGERWQQLISENDLGSTVERQGLEPKQRPGALRTDDLLSYVDTPILTKLVLNQWSRFAPVFGNRDRMKQSFNAFVVYRRRVAHNRPLLPFERDLLSGLAGQFRNQISLYRQKANPKPGYFSSIDSSSDPEGRPGSNELRTLLDSSPIVRVGETLTFSATASDPRERRIEWDLQVTQEHIPNYVMNIFDVKAEGESVRLDWTPQPDDFGSTVYVWLVARNGSAYYRSRYGIDDSVVWAFTFEPPL
jgi:hypothetical protein